MIRAIWKILISGPFTPPLDIEEMTENTENYDNIGYTLAVYNNNNKTLYFVILNRKRQF